MILVYLTGSLPISKYLIFKYKHIDIQKFGSRNIGATNTSRILGNKGSPPQAAGYSLLKQNCLF